MAARSGDWQRPKLLEDLSRANHHNLKLELRPISETLSFCSFPRTNAMAQQDLEFHRLMMSREAGPLLGRWSSAHNRSYVSTSGLKVSLDHS